MSDYLKRIHIDSVEEIGIDTTDSAYLKRVEIVEMVDQDGDPWAPDPGPDPFDELVVAEEASWFANNNYSAGNSIYGVTGTFAGGTEDIVYRSRMHYKEAGSSTWNQDAWFTHANAVRNIPFAIQASEANGELMFQTQAYDTGGEDPVEVNTYTSVKNVTPFEWDPVTATVNDIEYNLDVAPPLTVLINDPLPIVVTHNAAVTGATYQWSSRDGNPMFGTPTAKNTVITFPEAGTYIVTLTMQSAKTAESKSIIITFYAVDAF